MSVEQPVEQAATLDEFLPKVAEFVGEDWKNTWFVFDLDETLVRPKKPVFTFAAIQMHWHRFMEALTPRLNRPLTPEEDEALGNAAVVDTELEFVEPGTEAMLQDLRQKGSTVLALTATLSGVLPPHPCFAETRAKQCRQQGLTFEPLMDDFEIPQLAPFRGSYPRYHDGILFANGALEGSTKGQVLCEFLKHWDRPHPKKLVFLDDTARHVVSIKEELAAYDPTVEVLSVEYTNKKHHKVDVPVEEFLETWLKVFERISPRDSSH